MNVLILSANTGQGHNSCAAALQEVFRGHGENCEVCDSLAFMSEGISKFVSSLHVNVYRKAPGAFAWGYGVTENHPGIFSKRSPLYGFFKKGAGHLAEYIEGRNFDVVIACHVFASVMLTAAQEIDPQPFKSAFIATDYTCSPSGDQSALDYYFIPDESLKGEFAAKLAGSPKICSTGIPVRKSFLERTDKKEAKRSFGVDENHAHLIVMCGSMGCGPLLEAAHFLASRLAQNQEASIVCGTNSKLKRKLDGLYPAGGKLHILGYVDNMSLLMDSADLYLTKPGGLSSTEAAVKGLPMVFVNAVSGCEEYNCAFFTEREGAVCVEGAEALSERCVKLLADPFSLKTMSSALEKSVSKNAAENIYKVLAGA